MMVEITKEPISLVVGGGRKGLEWAVGQTQQGTLTLCIDHDSISLANACFFNASVFDLGWVLDKEKIVSHIYADFLLNAVYPKNVNAKTVIDNPEILGTEVFPSLVREWFLKGKHGRIDVPNGDLVELRRVLRQAALREMWRVLAVGGEISIIDRRYIIEWIVSDTTRVLQVDRESVEVAQPKINSSDSRRSNSLVRILKVWNEAFDNVGKVCLKKPEAFY